MSKHNDRDYFVHDTAVVDKGCRIGKNSKVWHFCHLMAGAEIGTNCILGQNVFVGKDVRLGDGVKVQNNVSLYTGLKCEDNVFIGPSAVFTNVMNPRSAIERKAEFLPTILRKGATIGANATIICGISIGRYAFIGAAAVVTKDVPDFALVTGNPARQSGWMSRNGLKLEFDESGRAVCPESHYRYKIENERLIESKAE